MAKNMERTFQKDSSVMTVKQNNGAKSKTSEKSGKFFVKEINLTVCLNPKK